ncbi:MAG: pyruvate kinase [Lachnospiraceae bacterium]|nr:pyruvate kinase [Lachnospiraceae bacterium]
MNKKTKVICTIGPSSDNREIMKQLILNGMDVARFNFSHGKHEEHKARHLMLREVAAECGIPIAVLLDIKGPEIRTCTLKGGKKVFFKEDQDFILTTENHIGDENMVQINYDGLNEDVEKGTRILIDDGLIELHVKYVDGSKIHCTVINGGELGERKGVNVPGMKIKLPALTDKDKEDIRFGIEMGFDYVAASFIRSADAIHKIREILKEGGSSMGIIAKIENEEGLENLDAIINASDGIMVARGDLGVEVAPERLPHLQKMIITKCSEECKIVITATQMLDSMIRNPRPTRAEVTDVANAVYDGTDVVMLSGETASGKYPVEALKMMVQIVAEAEAHLDKDFYAKRRVDEAISHNISNAISYSSVTTAKFLGAKVILSPTLSGYTARMLSKWHPYTKIIGVSDNMEAVRRMQLYWGVTPFLGTWAEIIDTKIMNAIDMLKEKEIIAENDLVVVTAGAQGHSRKNDQMTGTNGIRVVIVD